MATVHVPNFSRSVDDVPTGDWTVEEAFQWLLLKSNEEGERLLNDIIKDIEEQCKLGEQELLQAKRQVEAENQLQLALLPTTAMNLEKDVNNRRDFVVQAAVATNKVEPVSKKAAATSAPLGTVHVDIVAGPYIGKKFTLKVTSRAPRLVGRSQSKNFRDKGISLSKDLEVSTSHGKFVLIKDKVYFVDTESTNGTLVSESGDNTSSNDHTTTDQMEPNEPYQLSTGTMITCGQTVMKITLP